jgi:hypothetical protein
MQLTHPHVFQCDCGQAQHSGRPAIPVGWSTGHGLIWCRDCTASGVPERHFREHSRAARKSATAA